MLKLLGRGKGAVESKTLCNLCLDCSVDDQFDG